MIATYDMTKVGLEIKSIRKSLGHTITDVSRYTGISESTIKQIEAGKSIPRLDTVQILSSFFKHDLLSTLLNGIKNSNIDTFIKVLAQATANGDSVQMNNLLQEIQTYMECNVITPIENKDLTQIVLYLKGLRTVSVGILTENNHHEEAIHYYTEALKINNTTFSIELFDNFKYTAVEMNILFSAAVSMGVLRNCIESNKILFFVLRYCNNFVFSDSISPKLLSKIFNAISYNYHRMDNHEKALHYARVGIKHCDDADTLAFLPHLLGREAIALKHLEYINWKTPLDYAISILKVHKKNSLITIFERMKSE